MSGTLSKRARSQSTVKSTARATRSKSAVKPVAVSSRRGTTVAVKKAQEVKAVVARDKKKPVATTISRPAKAKAAAKKVASRVEVKAAKKTLTKPIATKARPKPAKKAVKVKEVSKSPVPTNGLPKTPVAPHLLLPLTPAPPPLSAPLPRKQSAQQALQSFERAVKAFNRKDFVEAKSLFESLQQRYPHEVDVLARAQMYIQVCNSKISKLAASPAPGNPDELYDCGVVALNVGNFAQARAMFENALKLRPDDSHTLYSLAATHAQSGAPDQALSYLRLAVQRQPRFRQRALNDNDFSALHEDRRFLELLGAASPFDRLESRREVS